MADKRYAVAWAATARDDLDGILTYIMADSPLNAITVLERIEASAQSLVSLPERGRVVPELQAHGVVGYRELIIRPWRLMYRVSNATVQVVALLDARRQLEDLLLDRFLRP